MYFSHNLLRKKQFIWNIRSENNSICKTQKITDGQGEIISVFLKRMIKKYSR